MYNLYNHESQMVSGGLGANTKSVIGVAGSIVASATMIALMQNSKWEMLSNAAQVADQLVIKGFGVACGISFMSMIMDSSSGYYEATRDENLFHIHEVG